VARFQPDVDVGLFGKRPFPEQVDRQQLHHLMDVMMPIMDG